MKFKVGDKVVHVSNDNKIYTVAGYIGEGLELVLEEFGVCKRFDDYAFNLLIPKYENFLEKLKEIE